MVLNRTNTFSIVILLAFFAFGSTAFAANDSEQKLYADGKKALQKENYEEAKEALGSLVKLNTDKAEYDFLAGLAWFRSGVNREMSIPHFEKSISKFKTDTIAEAYYYLGKAYALNGQPQKALDAFEDFKTFIISSNEAGSKMAAEVDYMIDCLKFGQSNTEVADVKITNIESLNTVYPEYAPVLTPDKQAMLFTSRRNSATGGKMAADNKFFEDIEVAVRNGDSWEASTDPAVAEKYLYKGYNTNEMDAGVVYTLDGKRLFVYKNDKIYESIFGGSSWSKPEEVSTIGKGAEHIPSVALTPDGKTMYFSSQRDESLGGRDLYRATLQEDGKWSTPINLGNTLNTSGDEDSPWLSEDGQTLYFSSNGLVGHGGYDIFRCEMSEGDWGTPQNMGLPFNSPADDIYYVEEIAGEKGFFASSRIGSKGDMDLFAFNNSAAPIETIIAGIAYDPRTKTYLSDVNLELLDAETQEVVATATPNAGTGEYELTAPSDRSYILRVNSGGPAPYSNEFHVPKQTLPFHTSQVLEISELSDDDGQIVAQSMLLKTGFYDADKRVEAMKADGTWDEDVEINLDNKTGPEGLTALQLFNQPDFNKDDERYLEIRDTLMLDLLMFNPNAITFKKYFGYNENNLTEADAKFKTWVDNLAVALQGEGQVAVSLEASASKVPTQTFQSNKKLATTRAEKAKAEIEKALKGRGLDVSRLHWNLISGVNGPSYQGDAEENRPTYEKFQYVNLSIDLPE